MGAGRTHDSTRHGRVVDADGLAVAHALVEVLDDQDALVDWSHTNGDGVFAIAVPEPRAFRTVVSAEGWQPESIFVDYSHQAGEPKIHLSRRVEQTLG